MRLSLLRLTIIVLLSGLLLACAQQPVSPGPELASGYVSDVDCYGNPDSEYCYNQEHGHHDAAAGLFAYIIFRLVVEGMVHAVFYH